MPITPMLMFQGRAAEAMALYTSLFPGAKVVFRQDAPHLPERVLFAELELAGQRVRFMDSDIQHAFTFTPATSLFVDCQDETEVRALYAALSEGGGVLMPLQVYDFSPLYAWVNDRFGVSWQLSLNTPLVGEPAGS